MEQSIQIDGVFINTFTHESGLDVLTTNLDNLEELNNFIKDKDLVIDTNCFVLLFNEE